MSTNHTDCQRKGCPHCDNVVHKLFKDIQENQKSMNNGIVFKPEQTNCPQCRLGGAGGAGNHQAYNCTCNNTLTTTRVKIGMLRQWLNEDRSKSVTNEDIMHWLK